MESKADERDLTRRMALKGAAGVVLGAAGLAAAGSAVSAQSATPTAGAGVAPTFMLTAEGAMTILQAAVAKAQEISVPEVVAIVDAAGTLKALLRMDGAPFASIDVATDKAYTSASFQVPTDQFAKDVSADPVVMASILKVPHVSLLAGGYPIMSGDTLIGAIGVSGGSGEQDQECAQAGLAALGA
jgi:glc operon protein GlcG